MKSSTRCILSKIFRMRISLVLLLLCYFSHLNAQNALAYNYTYKFQLDNPKEVSKLEIDTIENKKDYNTIKGFITNTKSEPIQFITITLRNKHATISTTTNESGLFEIKANPSTYQMTITGVGYKSLDQKLTIERKNNFMTKASLATEASLNWYEIHSTEELSVQEINSIKKCVHENRNRPDKCRKKNSYYVTMEI